MDLTSASQETTSSVPGTKPPFTFYSEFEQRWSGGVVLETVVFVIIFSTGMVGNIMVLRFIRRNRKSLDQTDVLIINLAVASLLMLLSIPPIATTRLTVNWILGEFMCKATIYIQILSGSVIASSIMFISVKRNIAVRKCTRNRGNLKNMAATLAAIWIIPAAMTLMYAIHLKLSNKNQVYYCYLDLRVSYQIALMVCLFGLCFVVPLFVTIIGYTSLWCFVSSSTNTVINGNRAKKRRRMARLFSVTVLFFVLLWLPFMVVYICLEMDFGVTSTIFTASVTVLNTTVVINPIIYGYLNQKYRQAFLNLIPCHRKRTTGADSISGSHPAIELGPQEERKDNLST